MKQSEKKKKVFVSRHKTRSLIGCVLAATSISLSCGDSLLALSLERNSAGYSRQTKENSNSCFTAEKPHDRSPKTFILFTSSVQFCCLRIHESQFLLDIRFHAFILTPWQTSGSLLLIFVLHFSCNQYNQLRCNESVLNLYYLYYRVTYYLFESRLVLLLTADRGARKNTLI